MTGRSTYPWSMSTPHSRTVTPVQMVALLLAFLSISGLVGVLGAGIVVPLAGSAGVVVKTVPSVFEGLPADLQVVDPAVESTMVDAKGNPIAVFYDKQRIIVPSDKIADTMKTAIVAIEDKRFYEHHGVDPDGVLRAFVNNLGDSGSTQGASTITQQYVRNMLLEKGYLEGDIDLVNDATAQTPQRKLREMKYALTLETQMSKDQILTGYLNIAPFGPITYGVEAAARRYFSTSASELSMNQAALLAGLVQSPVEYDPLVYPEAAQERRDQVLQALLDQGQISEEEFEEYKAVDVADMLKPNEQAQGCSGASDSTAYFCDYALNEFLNDPTYGETVTERKHLLETGGLEIHTTIDPDKQKAAHATAVSALPVDNPYGSLGLNDVIVSIEPKTGDILSMAQNTQYGVTTDEHPRATQVNFSADGRFQVGSTFKLFTLIQWFKEGHGAYDTVGSGNRSYPAYSFSCNGKPIYTEPYVVEDLPGKDGPMSVMQATGLSVNQAFINMASKVDFCQIFQNAYDLGIKDPDTGGVPLTVPGNIIGSVATSPLNMAMAFATVQNNGKECAAQPLANVTDRSGNVLKEYKPDCKQVLDSKVAQQVSTLLMKANKQYYDFSLSGGRQFAAKTGTTDNNSNTWTLGFTPQIATAAWMGFGHASSTSVENVTVSGQFTAVPYGSTVGANIWAPYMDKALSGTPNAALPDVFIGNQPKAAPTPTTTAPAPAATTQQGNGNGNDDGNGNGGNDDSDQGDN